MADLSYLRCWEGLVFFAFVIDAYSRKVVGWQLAGHLRTMLVLDALRMTLQLRDPGADVALVPDSDRGSRYTFDRLHPDAADHGVLASVGWSATPTTTRWPRAFVDSFESGPVSTGLDSDSANRAVRAGAGEARASVSSSVSHASIASQSVLAPRPHAAQIGSLA